METAGEILDATLTPALFARAAGRGKWRMAPHLSYLDTVLVDAITRGGGRLIVTMPPRHGKSALCSQYLPAWFLGCFPDREVILASYGDHFASEWGGKARNLLEQYGRWFGVSVDRRSSAADRWRINQHDGAMRTAGVGGPITGRGAHLLIIDDPIKNAEEAESETYRKKTWDWWQSVAYSRLEPNATVVVIMTRWHEDDLVGRLLWNAEHGDGERWTVINFPAIAEDHDALGREPGEALWPWRYPVEKLYDIRRNMHSYFWNALYQQRPAPLEGGIFLVDKINATASMPDRKEIADIVRFWDLAGTATGDYSAGVLMAKTHEGRYIIMDVQRGQWTPHVADKKLKDTAKADGLGVRIGIEEEPGSAGKRQTAYLQNLLAGYGVFPHRPTGPKKVRWLGLAAQVEAGMVDLAPGGYNAKDFLDELRAAPNGKYDDQCDAAAGAFGSLAHGRFATPGIMPAGHVDTDRYGVRADLEKRPALSNRRLGRRYGRTKE